VLGGEPRSDIRCRRPDAAASPADPSQRKDYTHGFSGKEHDVVTAITDWAVGRRAPDRIGS
jgi:hypothetical protein